MYGRGNGNRTIFEWLALTAHFSLLPRGAMRTFLDDYPIFFA